MTKQMTEMNRRHFFAAAGTTLVGVPSLASMTTSPSIRNIHVDRGVTIEAANGTAGHFAGSRAQDLATLQRHLSKIRETLVGRDPTVTVSPEPPIHPITMWYSGTPDNPGDPRMINFPKICGIVIDVNADNVAIEGLRIHMAPTVGVEVNNSRNVTIRNCFFSGYQFAINTGYECTLLNVEHCEMDGGEMISFGGHDNVTNHMWNHSTYVNPIKFNGTGLTFKHNYVYEGFDLFHPRGRHKDFPDVPDLRSEVAYNVWQNAIDNALEFDGVEARMNMRVHHNLILQDYDALAITTTENGERFTVDFEGLTDAPEFGRTSETFFLLQPGSAAINAGVAKRDYHQENVTDDRPDLGALEYGQTIDDWRRTIGHVGPTWITAANAAKKAPHRPAWPAELDKRWGGLNAGQ